MEGEEQYLWLFHVQMNGTSRMWWAYFNGWPAVQACLAEITESFPGLEFQRLEACQDGLRVLDYLFAATRSEQERTDTLSEEMVSERNRQFFPLAPLTCDYLASFRASLGSARERGA